MKNSTEPRRGFPVVQTVVGGVTVVALAWAFFPTNTSNIGGLSTYLSNAKQIHQAGYRMVLDNAERPNSDLGWAGDLAASPVNPVASTGDYVERLVQYKYLDRGSLAKLFAGPSVPKYENAGAFLGKNSVFQFYNVTDADSDTTLFLAGRNFTYGSPLDPKQPYGTKIAVIVRKGGDAQRLSAKQASEANVGVLPAHLSKYPGPGSGYILPD